MAQPDLIPHLERRGAVTQLIVDGKPFLMLSGELNNSSSSSLDYMQPIWPKLAAEGLNTIVTPLSWELIEPVEGTYDFALVDGLLAQARQEHLHIVFLWLASWKNGMSSYPPVWVKQDAKRFPRVERANGTKVGILSPQSDALRDADARAFVALMKHLKTADVADHTVLMMQVENEVGVLGDSRDRSPEANQSFQSPVPKELIDYLKAHKDSLEPELLALWVAHGEKTAGSWPEVFGDGARADEIFMAWNYARFIQTVAERGKAAYNLPMYVNTWLGGGEAKPGDYPSGGPQPRVIDIWKAAGSSLDIYAPDLYASDFSGWSTRYHRPDNPLYMPETNGGATGAANVFYAVGEHAALGFSPFAIDSYLNDAPPPLPPPSIFGLRVPDPTIETSYKAITQVAPYLLEAQTKGNAHGFLLDRSHPEYDFAFEGYIAHVSLDDIFGNRAEKGFGLIVETSPGQFLGAGRSFRVSFSPSDPASRKQIGIASVDEGKFVDGQWVPGRRLNGDENDQGNYWRFDQLKTNVEKASVYGFE
jgi:beta-galactosidase GanA